MFGDRIALGDLEPTLGSERHREALARAAGALDGRGRASRPRRRGGAGVAPRPRGHAGARRAGRGGGCGGGAGEGVRRVLRGEVSECHPERSGGILRPAGKIPRRFAPRDDRTYADCTPRAPSSASWNSCADARTDSREPALRRPAPRSSGTPGNTLTAPAAPGRPPAARKGSFHPRGNGAAGRARSAPARAPPPAGGTPPSRGAGGTAGGGSRSTRRRRTRERLPGPRARRVPRSPAAPGATPGCRWTSSRSSRRCRPPAAACRSRSAARYSGPYGPARGRSTAG